MSLKLGVFTSGEVPNPLTYTFQTSAGAAMDELDNPTWTLTFRWQRNGGTAESRTGTIVDGVATHTWEDGDLDDVGTYKAEFVATNGTNTYISPTIRFNVRSAITV